jgi:hypothetical protein
MTGLGVAAVAELVEISKATSSETYALVAATARAKPNPPSPSRTKPETLQSGVRRCQNTLVYCRSCV